MRKLRIANNSATTTGNTRPNHSSPALARQGRKLGEQRLLTSVGRAKYDRLQRGLSDSSYARVITCRLRQRTGKRAYLSQVDAAKALPYSETGLLRGKARRFIHPTDSSATQRREPKSSSE